MPRSLIRNVEHEAPDLTGYGMSHYIAAAMIVRVLKTILEALNTQG